MKKILGLLTLSALLLVLAAPGRSEEPGLASRTGNLLRGTVYKTNNVAREGVVTIRTTWNLPTTAPVYRYDFDILNGTIEGNLYTYLMADIAEMVFLPQEDGMQPVNILLRNGLLQKILLTSESKTLVGKMGLQVREVDVITDNYGENIISGGDVQKIVFSGPRQTATMPMLKDDLARALEVGRRDELIDEKLLTVLQNIQKSMSATPAEQTPEQKKEK